MTDNTTDLVALLKAHRLYDDDGGCRCGCGWKPSVDAWRERYGEEDEHAAHLAAVVWAKAEQDGLIIRSSVRVTVRVRQL